MTPAIKWLIDTNVVSEMMRTQPNPRVANFLDSVAFEEIGKATITVWEILNGISRLDFGGYRRSLSIRFQELVDVQFEDRIIDWTRR